MIDELWSVFFCFFRICPWFLTVPFFFYLPSKFKAPISFILSIAIASCVKTPPAPIDLVEWVPLIFSEIMAGLFLGFFVKVLMVAIEIAGFLIGFELNLNNASVFDPQTTASNTVVSQFLSLAAIAVLFESDAHHYLITGLLKSYSWLPCPYYIQDMNTALLNAMIASLEMGLHLCVPVLIIGTASYFILGILSRILSGLHIFFVMIPGQIVLNLLIFTSTFIPLLKAFLIYIKDNVHIIVK